MQLKFALRFQDGRQIEGCVWLCESPYIMEMFINFAVRKQPPPTFRSGTIGFALSHDWIMYIDIYIYYINWITVLYMFVKI